MTEQPVGLSRHPTRRSHPTAGPQHRAAERPVRTQRLVYLDLLPPCNNACPAGENIQAWLACHRRAVPRGVGDDRPRQSPARRSRPGLLSPVRDELQPRSARRAVSIHAVERFLGDMAVAKQWHADDRRGNAGKRVLDRRRRPERPVGAPTTWRGWATRSRSARPARSPGGMMHFGIPAYRLPREELMKEVRASRRWASRSCSITRWRTCSPRRQRGVSMPSSWRSARTSEAHRYSGPRRRQW